MQTGNEQAKVAKVLGQTDSDSPGRMKSCQVEAMPEPRVTGQMVNSRLGLAPVLRQFARSLLAISIFWVIPSFSFQSGVFGLAPESVAPGDQLSRGRVLFSEVCSECHALPNPAQKVPGGWTNTIRRMEHYRRGRGRQPLSGAQLRLIRDYLESEI